MKEIELTKGFVALVDDADHEELMRFSWRAAVRQRGSGLKRVYAIRSFFRTDGKRSTVSMHSMLSGYPMTDHRDGYGLNNQRGNLRPATYSQNNANRRKSSGRSSVFLGVTRRGALGKWGAGIGYQGKYRFIGLFKEETDAALAYNLKAEELFGEFASFNIPLSEILHA